MCIFCGSCFHLLLWVTVCVFWKFADCSPIHSSIPEVHFYVKNSSSPMGLKDVSDFCQKYINRGRWEQWHHLAKNHQDKMSTNMELWSCYSNPRGPKPTMHDIGKSLPACAANLVETRTKGLIQRSVWVNRAFSNYFSGLWIPSMTTRNSWAGVTLLCLAKGAISRGTTHCGMIDRPGERKIYFGHSLARSSDSCLKLCPPIMSEQFL